MFETVLCSDVGNYFQCAIVAIEPIGTARGDAYQGVERGGKVVKDLNSHLLKIQRCQ